MAKLTRELEQSVISYLNASGCAFQIEQARAASGKPHFFKPVLIPMNVVSLAADFPELAFLLYHDADRFCFLLYQVLINAKILHQSERINIRPIRLLEEASCCKEAIELIRSFPSTTVSMQGVCCAASAVIEHRHSCILTCNGCGEEAVVPEGKNPPSCCGSFIHKTEEHRIITCKTQLMYLTQSFSPSNFSSSVHTGEPTIAVYLQDDLCGQVHVGDQVMVLGVGRRLAELNSNSSLYGCRAMVQVDALCAEKLPSAGPRPQHPSNNRVQRMQPSLAGLTELLNVMRCCFDAPCKPQLMLAFLLSAATAGVQHVELQSETGVDDEMESYVLAASWASRAQVNLLLLTEGHEPHLQRLLHQAAAGLFQQKVTASHSPKQLLPRIFEKFVEPRLQLQTPLSIAGELAEANSGVLLLNTGQLSPALGLKLASCTKAGWVNQIPSRPELSGRLSPTLWCLSQRQDSCKARGKQGVGEPGEASERLAATYGPHFLSLWDMHLECSVDIAETEFWAEHLLSTTQRQQVAVQSVCANGAGGSAHWDGIAQAECSALETVQAHIRRSVSQTHPKMGAEAMTLLSGYFAIIRVAEDSPQGILETLARVATASARLCHRHQVLPFPDATLAVMFMEEQLICRGGIAAHWGKWRRELDRGTELMVCLEGLYCILQDSLSNVVACAAEE